MIFDRIALTQLPRFTEWQESFPTIEATPSNFLYQFGNLDLAFAFAELFFPKIICVHGRYFRQQGYQETFSTLDKDMSLEKKQDAERLVNQLHLYDLFLQDHKQTQLEVEEELAKFLISSWTHATMIQHPGIEFAFDFQTEPNAYGPTISFWQL